MKRLTRYFCVLLCCLLLSVGCSVSAKADELHLDNTQLQIVDDIYIDGVKTNLTNFIIYPNDGTQQSQSVTDYRYHIPINSIVQFKTVWTLSIIDGARLIKGGNETKLILDNGYYNIGYKYKRAGSGGNLGTLYVEPIDFTCLLEYIDGSYEYIDISSIGTTRNIVFETKFTPQKDVKSIEFHINSEARPNTMGFACHYDVWVNSGEYEGDNSFISIIETQSEEVGLLSGILGWLKNVYDSIVNLPSKLWGLISDGLKSLFVPSEEYLTQFKNDMDTLLSEKLGAIYQVVNILSEGWDRIQANDSTNTIDFPQVTIPLPDNNEFTFGGQTVAIVPDGFDFLVTAIKLIVGICCTILFVNGLKKRYDDIMGG